MRPRFFSDETDLGLAKKLEQNLPGQVVYPGHPELPDVPRGCKDEEWLHHIGQRRLVVVTRDKQIRTRPVLKSMWVRFQVRGFVLTARRNQATGGSLAILDKHWNRIETYIQQHPDGPWMCAVTASGLRRIVLQGMEAI